MKNDSAIPGTRHDFKTGQFFPTLNGKDISPSSFDEARALEIAHNASLDHQPSVRHTPGAWVSCEGIDDCDEYARDIHTAPRNGFHEKWIATIHTKQTSREEMEANAQLIASAPDMLEALQELLADKYLSDPINADRMAKAKAAVAKATGSSL